MCESVCVSVCVCVCVCAHLLARARMCVCVCKRKGGRCSELKCLCRIVIREVIQHFQMIQEQNNLGSQKSHSLTGQSYYMIKLRNIFLSESSSTVFSMKTP